MISVAMATYNGEKYITEQLQSIYYQTRRVDEIVITDDCSTDETVTMVREFMKRYPDCKVRLFVNDTNLGDREKFRKAVSLCVGDIIFLSDQDDIWKEDKVEVLECILTSHAEVSLVSSSFVQIDSAGNVVSENKNLYKKRIKSDEPVEVPLEDLIFHNISQGCAMAFKKEVRDLFLKHFTEELPHDWILNVVAAMQKKCYYVKRALFCYRIHEKNTIGTNDNMTLQMKNTLGTRIFDAQQAIKVLTLIESVDSVFYHKNAWLEKTKRFSKNHVQYLENRSLNGLLIQNFNPCYKKLKTFRGRILDIYFVLHK